MGRMHHNRAAAVEGRWLHHGAHHGDGGDATRHPAGRLWGTRHIHRYRTRRWVRNVLRGIRGSHRAHQRVLRLGSSHGHPHRLTIWRRRPVEHHWSWGWARGHLGRIYNRRAWGMTEDGGWIWIRRAKGRVRVRWSRNRAIRHRNNRGWKNGTSLGRLNRRRGHLLERPCDVV